MNTYFCKCGRVVHKSTDADNTGNRDVKGCTGCSYLLPYGEQEYIKGEGFHLKVKGYECRVSKSLEYASRFSGSVTDKCTCSVVSLDYEFLTQINNWIRATYPNGELSGSFSLENIRPTGFSDNGRYRYSLYCAQNKKGMAAKAALLEKFFNQDGSRKDMTPEEEEKKIKDLIENGKRAAQGAAANPEQTPAAPEEKRNILAAENQIFIDPNGVKYRIGIEKGFGKKIYWRTERMDNGEWIPNNSSAYPKFENAQGEFAACIRVHSLVPLEEADTAPKTPPIVPKTPASPETLPAAPASLDAGGVTEALATVPDALPAFDYSGLDSRARDSLRVAENLIKEARQKFISDVADAVAIAHDTLCGNSNERKNGVVTNCDNSKHGNRGESAFINWCASVGFNRMAAYRLLQVSTLFKGSTPIERQVLEQAQPSLLYAAAKPSAPAEAVAAVKSGDITTHKQYQGLLAEINARDEKIEKLIDQSEKIEQALNAVTAEKAAVTRRANIAQQERDAAQKAMIEAKQERDAARDMLEKAKRRANHLVQERDDALEHLDAVNSEMDELRARPIEVAVAEPDPAEIERLATEKAESIAAQRTAELKAQVDKLQQEAQENRAQDAEDLKMQDYDTVIFAISVIQNAWKSAGPSFRRLDSQCREQLRRNLRERLAEIEKAVNVC